MKNRKVKALRIVIAVLLIADMALIFAFSAQKAEQSDGTSTGLIEILAKMFYPGFEALEREAQQAVVASFQFVVRKAAHLTEFASLGVLLCAIAFTFGEKFRVYEAVLRFIPSRRSAQHCSATLRILPVKSASGHFAAASDEDFLRGPSFSR